MLSVLRSVVAAEGVAALFTGWTAAVARAFPANAGLFLGVEVSSRWMARLLDNVSADAGRAHARVRE